MSVTTIKTESREQWLDARRRYVTATEVAQLVRRGQDYWDELREIKAGTRTAADVSGLPAVRPRRERAELVRRGQDYWDELREVTAGPRSAPDISGLPAGRHGREREALIAPYVQSLEQGMAPNEDLYVRNERYAATPDLVGDGIVGE